MAGVEWQKISTPGLATEIADQVLTIKKGGVMRIWCGPARPDIFNDTFKRAVRYAHRQSKVRLRVITGPYLIKDEQGQNPMLELAQEGDLEQMLHRPRMGEHAFFRVGEIRGGYIYAIHPAPKPKELGHDEHLVATRIETGPRRSRIRGPSRWAADYFDGEVDSLTDPRYSLAAQDLPLLLTQEEAQVLKQEALERGFCAYASWGTGFIKWILGRTGQQADEKPKTSIARP